jgi:short-subunit dehydrogenase
MGLATAKILGKSSKLVIVGRNKAKLEHAARELGEQGARVVSVTPGNFETPMGELERA